MVLGKIAIVIGSGIIGTLVTGGDAGKLPDLRDVLSVSFKFMTKQDKKEGASAASPHTDQLLSQVNYLREQLRVLSDQKEMPHIIINGRPGAGAYGLTAIALGALGYLYIRWKGWKIADLMFVTKRGLSDACNVVGKQLDQVSESVHASKKHLSGRIDRVDCSLDECHEIIEATGKEVTVIHGDLSAFQEEIQSVHLVVRTLETKLGRLAYTQDHTTRGIHELCEFTKRLDRSPKAEALKITSPTPLPAIESSEGITRESDHITAKRRAKIDASGLGEKSKKSKKIKKKHSADQTAEIPAMRRFTVYLSGPERAEICSSSCDIDPAP